MEAAKARIESLDPLTGRHTLLEREFLNVLVMFGVYYCEHDGLASKRTVSECLTQQWIQLNVHMGAANDEDSNTKSANNLASYSMWVDALVFWNTYLVIYY